MAYTSLPVTPSRNRPVEFPDEGDAFLGALPLFGSEMEASRIEVATNKLAAASSALAAAGSATAAGAIAWVSGTTYAIGNARYSPIDGQTYRRKTAGAGATDPSLDGTNWVRINLTATSIARSARTSNTILAEADRGNIIDVSGTWTQTATAAATLGNGWHCYVRNIGAGDITIDPSAPELIDGAATYTLKPGYAILLTCDGATFNILTLKSRSYEFSQYTASGSFTVPAETYVIRPYVFGAGGTGTGAQSGGGGGCAYGDIAVTPGEVVTLSISAGVAKITTAGVDRLTANPASGMTAGTASKHASVTNGGAYSGGTGSASARGGASSGSPLGTGVSNVAALSGGAGWGGVGNSSSGGGVGSVGGGLILPSSDPLLAGLDSPAPAAGGNGGPGAGGGSAVGGGVGGVGGMGCGGGCAPTAGSGTGGAGGLGGGGGGSNSTSGAGVGGYGGGGGCGTASPTAGGAAVIRVYF